MPMNRLPWMTGGPPGTERLLRGYSGRMFVLVALGVLLANLGRQALPPMLPTIIEELAITSATAGIAFTLMRVAFAVLQYPSGRIADAISRKSAIVGGLGILILGFGILTQVRTYAVFLVSMTLLGIGAALFFVSERVLLSDLFVQRRGRAFGFNSAVSRIGSILAAGLAVVALSFGSWQRAFLPVIGGLAVVVVGFHLLGRESYHLGAVSGLATGQPQLRDTVNRVFGTPAVRWLVVAYTLIIFVWEGVMAFLPAYLQATKGFTPEIASGGFAALFAAGIVVQPMAGTFSDWWDRRLVAGAATGLSLIGLVVLLTTHRFVPIVTGIVLYAAGLMAFTPVLQAYLMDIFPQATKGGDLGAFKTVYEGLSSLGPTYAGVIAGIAGYTVAFGGFLACLAASAAILLWLYRVDPAGPTDG